MNNFEDKINEIFIISGKSSSGKNHIGNILKNQFGMKEIISDTTRPIRKNETDGVEYNFINDAEFLKRISENYYIDYRTYNTEFGIWYYGIPLKSIYDNDYCIVDLNGFLNLKNQLGQAVKLTSIFIDCDDDIRIERSFNRDDIDDIKRAEIYRRLEKDNIDFPEDIVKKEYDYILKNNNYEDLSCIINYIRNMIGGDCGGY